MSDSDGAEQRPHWLFVTGKLAEPALTRLLTDLAPKLPFDFTVLRCQTASTA